MVRSLLCLWGLLCWVGVACAQPAPRFGDAFWRRWGDGKAEVSAYELEISRYGVSRRGVAVAIFVTEPFRESLRVKRERPGGPDGDTFQVLKLNLVKDFPTGVYDYHLMLSAFVGLEPAGGRAAGTPCKLSFTAQEWCGQAAHFLWFDRGRVREQLHSYFDGEADRAGGFPWPAGGLSEDVLWHWARGFAGPVLRPGEEKRVSLLTSLQGARLRHVPLAWAPARLARGEGVLRREVPAGIFEVTECTAQAEGGRTWRFYVERAVPRRIVEWSLEGVERARLLGSQRMAYWKWNGPGGEKRLRALGLTPRPPRTP
ncbi:MAG: hypothetical protein D6731_05325 [Planctomycetota bacterium]|nr:MAG: hypothetical protein D6731_05325 [Planctomycetota bacterium]